MERSRIASPIGMRYNDAVELDQRLRSRIRMCYWKQWHRAEKRIGELIKLGVRERPAIVAGPSRKSYWHLAKTEAINVGLSKCLSQRAGTYINQSTVDQDSPSSNRPTIYTYPPGADPHARWCGGWGRKSPGYPIRLTHRLEIYPVAEIAAT